MILKLIQFAQKPPSRSPPDSHGVWPKTWPWKGSKRSGCCCWLRSMIRTTPTRHPGWPWFQADVWNKNLKSKLRFYQNEDVGPIRFSALFFFCFFSKHPNWFPSGSFARGFLRSGWSTLQPLVLHGQPKRVLNFWWWLWGSILAAPGRVGHQLNLLCLSMEPRQVSDLFWNGYIYSYILSIVVVWSIIYGLIIYTNWIKCL